MVCKQPHETGIDAPADCQDCVIFGYRIPVGFVAFECEFVIEHVIDDGSQDVTDSRGNRRGQKQQVHAYPEHQVLDECAYRANGGKVNQLAKYLLVK